MRKAELAGRSRSGLDRRLKNFTPVSRFALPVRGWTRAIRAALGMSSAQLAKRLGIAQPSVIALEQSEVKGTIQLATLRRVAAALDCTLVYSLVPNQPLEAMVRDRARLFARRRIEPIAHSMVLERQAVTPRPKESKARLDEIIRRTNPRLFWD
jgi:predicted DNA-binding mobile mystery protein A